MSRDSHWPAVLLVFLVGALTPLGAATSAQASQARNVSTFLDQLAAGTGNWTGTFDVRTIDGKGQISIDKGLGSYTFFREEQGNWTAASSYCAENLRCGEAADQFMLEKGRLLVGDRGRANILKTTRWALRYQSIAKFRADLVKTMVSIALSPEGQLTVYRESSVNGHRIYSETFVGKAKNWPMPKPRFASTF